MTVDNNKLRELSKCELIDAAMLSAVSGGAVKIGLRRAAVKVCRAKASVVIGAVNGFPKLRWNMTNFPKVVLL